VVLEVVEVGVEGQSAEVRIGEVTVGRVPGHVALQESLSSSWGNGHATTYRALLRAFAARGHDVLFLERDVPWYAAHRDLTDPDFCMASVTGVSMS
jgi:hypothetical protein